MCPLSFKERKVGHFCCLGQVLLCPEETQGVEAILVETILVETTAKDLRHTTIESPLRLPSKYLHGVASQYQTSYYS